MLGAIVAFVASVIAVVADVIAFVLDPVGYKEEREKEKRENQQRREAEEAVQEAFIQGLYAGANLIPDLASTKWQNFVTADQDLTQNNGPDYSPISRTR